MNILIEFIVSILWVLVELITFGKLAKKTGPEKPMSSKAILITLLIFIVLLMAFLLVYKMMVQD